MCYKLVKTFRFKTDTVIMPLTNACQIKWLKSQCEKLQAFLKQFKKPNTVTKLNIIVKQYSKRKIGQRPRNMGLMLAIGLPKMPFITTSGSSWYDSFKSYDERYTSYKSAFWRCSISNLHGLPCMNHSLRLLFLADALSFYFLKNCSVCFSLSFEADLKAVGSLELNYIFVYTHFFFINNKLNNDGLKNKNKLMLKRLVSCQYTRTYDFSQK